MIDVPRETHHKPELGRLTTRGRSTDDGSWTTLLLVHEIDESWTIHGLGAPGVQLSKSDMVTLAESILERCPVSGNGRAVAAVETDPVSAPLPEGVFHLLTADDDLACLYGGLVAVCGEVVSTSALLPRAFRQELRWTATPCTARRACARLPAGAPMATASVGGGR